jgi:peptidoglycan-N-acetylglucosamine deacetylase
MTLQFTCSVDDGHPADLKFAALLDRHGLHGTFYVPMRNQEGGPVLSAPALRELAHRFEVGSHTYSHQFLTRIDEKGARLEITDGKRALEDVLGTGVAGFCYPGGRYTSAHVRLVREAGFAYARTTVNLALDAGPGPYEMASTCQAYPHARAVYWRNFVRGGGWARRAPCLLAAVRERNWERRLDALLALAQQRGGIFHLWAHSADLEHLAAWRAVDRFLARVAQAVAPVHRLSNLQLAQQAFPGNTRRQAL